MAVSGTVPSTYRPSIDPVRIARLVRRITFLLGILTIGWFFTSFGTERAPPGPPTVPGVEPGALCIVDRRSSAIQVGRDVFVEVPGLGLLLSRVVAVDQQQLRCEHALPDSGRPDSRDFGPLPRTAVRGSLLVAFAKEEPK